MPKVVFHFGYRGAHHENEVYFRRSIMILNSLMGSIETPGGFIIKKGPADAGGKAARKLTEQEFPPMEPVRYDKVGTPDLPLPDKNHGAPQMLPHAILNEDPYPIKALINYRFDPLMSIPDTNLTKKALDKLDLIVAIDINFSDIAWYSDIILPESIFLERTDCVQQANGAKPQMFLRRKAVEPRYDTREGAMILKQLGERLGIGDYFPYESMEELVQWQLEPTGFTMEDFEAKGFVAYCSQPIFPGPERRYKVQNAFRQDRIHIFPVGGRGLSFISSLPVRSQSGRRRLQAHYGQNRPAHPCVHPEQRLPERNHWRKPCLDSQGQGQGHGASKMKGWSPSGPAGRNPSPRPWSPIAFILKLCLWCMASAMRPEKRSGASEKALRTPRLWKAAWIKSAGARRFTKPL